MTDLEMFVMGEGTGDGSDIAHDPALAAEARFEALLRDAAAAATFCPACDELVRDARCPACGAAVRPGGYTVERVLVGNAHGRMYVAHDADGKRVALKELAFVQTPSLDTISAFEREAKLLRALEHPAIPRFVASFEEGTGVHVRYYLAQELVDGKPLDQLDDRWYSEDEIVAIAREVLAVLVYLQALSPMVIHRDIKPANLIERASGAIAVVDFGAAHVQGATAGSTSIGTFGYMPIEQLAGVVDATTDAYALGAARIHLVTRQEPWRIAQQMPALNASAHLRGWLGKLVAPEPRDRFASAKDALAALDVKTVAVPPKRRRPRWPVIVAAAAFVAGGGTFATVHELTRPLPPHPDAMTVAPVVIDAHVPEIAPAPIPPPAVRVERETLLEVLEYDRVDLADVMRDLGARCDLNIVMSDDIRASVTVELHRVRCDESLETLLSAYGLGYDYRADANVLFVAPVKELDARRERALERARTLAKLGIPEHLPAGPTVDLDVKNVPFHDAIRLLADAGHINIVVPDTVAGSRVTMRASTARWDAVFEAVLESNGLWYRTGGNNLLRVAPRKELDAENERAVERR